MTMLVMMTLALQKKMHGQLQIMYTVSSCKAQSAGAEQGQWAAMFLVSGATPDARGSHTDFQWYMGTHLVRLY